MPARTEPGALWHIAGCGRMGSLAAAYLHAAGASVVVVRDHGPREQAVRLVFPTGQRINLDLAVRAASATGPIERLIVACKTPFTAAALHGLNLADTAIVLRLQNGIGSLDGHLGPTQRLIEVVTTSAVKSRDDGALAVVAENTTAFGGGTPPPFWARLASHWPNADWQADIRGAQWRKLVVNAVLNPLTALHDVDNGALVTDSALTDAAAELAAEADTVLQALDPAWPGDSLPGVLDVARATAANTSSMRADVQAGSRTEIDSINAWLVRQADAHGIEAPAHRRIVERIVQRHPGP